MSYVFAMLELWCLLFICLVLGRRLVDLLPSVMQRGVGFFIAPILGLAVLVLWVSLYGWFSPFRWYYSIPLTAILISLALCFETRKRMLWRDGLQMGVFSVLGALPIFSPLLRYGAYNPLTDIFTYLAQGQWLQHHAFAEKVITSGYYPALTQVASYQASGCRMGGTFFLAYVQSLFGLSWSYDAYMPTVALGFICGCLAIGGMIRQIVPVKRVIVLALALLPCLLTNGFIFGAEWGFFPQTYGLAFAAAIGALFPGILTHWIQIPQLNFRCIFFVLPLAISTAGLLLAYNESFPLFAIAMGLFVLIVGCFAIEKISRLGSFLVVYAFETLLLVNYESIRIFKNVYQTVSISHGFGDIGWPVLWHPIQFLAFAFGLKSPFSHHLFSVDTFISMVLMPVLLIAMLIVLFQWTKAYPKRRIALLFVGCIELVLLLLGLKFRYLVPNKSVLEVGHTFLQFKLAKYAAPFSLALLGAFVAIAWYKLKSYRRYLIYLYGITLTMGLYWHVWIVSERFTEPFLSATKSKHHPFDVLLSLRHAVAETSPEKVIHVQLGSTQSKLRQMVAYVLYDRKISSDYRDDGYILGHLPLSDVNMPIEGASELIVMKEPAGDINLNHQIVGPFVVQKPPFHYLLMGQQEGGYPTESNKLGDSWNWVNHAMNIPFSIIGDCASVKIKFNLEVPHPPSGFQIVLKSEAGTLLATYVILVDTEKKYFESPEIMLHKNKHLILHIETDGQAMRLSKADGREAAFMIKNVRLF